jgi:hypothetical protein
VSRVTYLAGIVVAWLLVMITGLAEGFILRVFALPTNSSVAKFLTYVDLLPVVFIASTVYVRSLHDFWEIWQMALARTYSIRSARACDLCLHLLPEKKRQTDTVHHPRLSTYVHCFLETNKVVTSTSTHFGW